MNVEVNEKSRQRNLASLRKRLVSCRQLVWVRQLICFVIGHTSGGQQCVRCGQKYGMPKFENPPPCPPKRVSLVSSVVEVVDSQT